MSGPIVLAVAPEVGMPRIGLSKENVLSKMPNIGILYLAAVVEKEGYDVVTMDRQYSAMTASAIVEEILSLAPSVVGFTMYDITAQTTHGIVSMLRRSYSGTIVIGGYTPTFHAQDILEQWPEVDFVVVREGEHAIRALLRHLRNELPIEEVPNLFYRQDGVVRHNPELPLEDVRALPWPLRQWPEWGDVTPLITRRGCYSRCSFCSMVPFYDTKLGPAVRLRDAVDVVDEIQHCIDHGSREFMFYDDDFGLSTKNDREWCARFLAEVQRRRLSFNWCVELRVIDVVRGGAQLLHDLCGIGLSHISMGMESLLPRQLKLYNKGYVPNDVFRAVEIANQLPIDHQTNVIFWDPWLTLDEAIEHMELLDRIRIQDQLTSANYAFYGGKLIARRGTRVHTDLSAMGLLRQDPAAFFSFDYDFVDPDVRSFYAKLYRHFTFRARVHPRPAALWLFVPRLEDAGRHDEAAVLRRYAQSIVSAEYDYFKALLGEARRVRGTDFGSISKDVYKSHGARFAECASMLETIQLPEKGLGSLM